MPVRLLRAHQWSPGPTGRTAEQTGEEGIPVTYVPAGNTIHFS